MIAICPNPFRDNGLALSRQAAAMLREAGFDARIFPVFAEDEPDVLPGDLSYGHLDALSEDCTLAVVVGGDGTILSVVRHLGDRELPILGINLGTKGFMASLEPEDLSELLRAARGECPVHSRMMLDVVLRRGGETVFHDRALNDAVIHGYGDCVQITAWCDGERMTSFSGDGVILSTPTGSTGYSMSAGGPIVEPTARAIILSPICAHMMSAKSFVLSAEREISVRTEKLHVRKAFLSIDGTSGTGLENGDELYVRRSSAVVRMVDPGIRSFYEIAYQKLQ